VPTTLTETMNNVQIKYSYDNTKLLSETSRTTSCINYRNQMLNWGKMNSNTLNKLSDMILNLLHDSRKPVFS